MNRLVEIPKAGRKIADHFGLGYCEVVDVLLQVPLGRQEAHWYLSNKSGKWRWHCDECGKYTREHKQSLPKFCSFCGSEMIPETPEEEE